MTRIFLEGMIARKKGHIVTITSSAAYYPLPWAVVYATSKTASAAFMSVLAEQLRFEKHDEYIKTTSILPYIINTEPTKGFKYT
jgi:all-trans-retinol dehydrogenase (NAD+)